MTRPPVPALHSGEVVPGYFVEVACPRCGGQLVHRAAGTPGLATRAVAACPACERLYGFELRMRDVTTEVARPSRAERRREAREKARVDGEGEVA